MWTREDFWSETLGEQRLLGKEKSDACKRAEGACDPEGILIVPRLCPNEASTTGSQSRTKLMSRYDPSVDDSRILPSEAIGGKLHRRRDCSDPIEPIEDCKPIQL